MSPLTISKRVHLSKENFIYTCLWTMLLVVPVLSAYIRANSDVHSHFQWSEVFNVWYSFLMYLAAFLIHNFILTPILVKHHKRTQYFVSVAVLILSAFLVLSTFQTQMRIRHDRNRKVLYEKSGKGFKPDKRPHPQTFVIYSHHRPILFIGPKELIDVVTLTLLMGMNLAIKLYFKNEGDNVKMQLLEQKNLEEQIKYLKYQINPHFFMNTLNNIHALVDIDPDMAKTTIVELSKMMRYLLYESDKHMTPLDKECDLIRNYVGLMSLRYNDNVHIKLDLDIDGNGKLLTPTLLTINFIENAFKHGVSYLSPSFIHIYVHVNNGNLCFRCSNSNHIDKNSHQSGVGLDNVMKRLELLFPDDYIFYIDESRDRFSVNLTYPLKNNPVIKQKI